MLAANVLGCAALGPLAAGFAFAQLGGRATLGLLAGWMLVLALVGTASPSLRTVGAAT